MKSNKNTHTPHSKRKEGRFLQAHKPKNQNLDAHSCIHTQTLKHPGGIEEKRDNTYLWAKRKMKKEEIQQMTTKLSVS